MTHEYCRGVLQVMVGQVCEQLGFDSVSSVSRDTLTDIMQAYIEELGYVAHNAAELANRSQANAHDVVMALDDSNVSVSNLRRYCEQSEALPLCHEIRQIPVRKRPRVVLEPSGVREDAKHIHEWLPKVPDEYKWRPAEGTDHVKQLSSVDQARGAEIRRSESALLKLRAAVPSAFAGADLPRAKAKPAMPPDKTDSAENPFLRPPTVITAEDTKLGRDSVKDSHQLLRPTPQPPFVASSMEIPKVNQILKLEHNNGIQYLENGGTLHTRDL